MGIPPPTPPQSPYQSRAQWKAQRAQWKMQSRMQRAAYRASYRGYARGSLVGPLLLLGIGVIALLMTTHHINATYFWQWYGHWWPLVLIGAGVVLALESLAFSRYARIRLGGGVVLLGLILVCIGIVAAHNNVNWTAVGDQLQLGNNVDLAQVFGKKHEATEQVTHALPANATVVIQNPRGDVTITEGGENQMEMDLDKTVYSNSGSEAAEKLRGFEPLITSSGNVVTVHMPSSDSQVCDVTIHLPANTALQVRTDHGDVTVNGRQAAVTVNAEHGDVQLSSIAGMVNATMHEGDLSATDVQGDLTVNGRMSDVTLSQVTGAVSLDGDFFGDVHLERLHGPVHLHSSRTDIQVASVAGSITLDSDDLTVENATGPVAIATLAKDVELRRVTGDLRIHNSDGDVDVKTLAPIGSVNIENKNGDVQVTLPEDAKFSVSATAVDGEIHTDYNLSTENGNEHSVVSGSVGGGGPLVHITAEKGDITLHKGGD